MPLLDQVTDHAILKHGNHWYVVYDQNGNEVGILQAQDHNKAEALAHCCVHPQASVCYTEL